MGFLDSLFGRDSRKFIKRKDSDAGEAEVLILYKSTGRALEEIRGSLYNELRTSDGAKRQQQRYCGPVVAMTFNFMVAVGIIMANKLVMGRVGFNFPIFLTLIHYTIAWFLLAIFKALSLLPVSPPTKTTPFSSLFSLGVVMAFASGLANTSLKHNSVGFYQMAKIAVTPTIVLALSVVSIGVAIATVTDLEFNLFGALIAIAWIIPSAINKILWSNLQQQASWTALALMWKTTPITIFFLLALMPWLDPPGVLSFKWDLSSSTAILTSALLGFLLQWSGALALGATSATSHVVLGQFKTCVILLGSYFVFGSDPGFVSICGAITALGGMSAYTSLNLRQQLDNKQQLPKHNLAIPKTEDSIVEDAPKSDVQNSDVAV
uniref:Sugar phosphate transporter domain-containing protein n=1 Tax=Cucumis melo TaxID=3656 RepID=A0A9I9D7B0_CUCME